jgi:GT2 family glycosyltransferase
MLPGAFLAMRRDVFEATGGFDDGLLRFGFNDAELSLRLWLLGYELRVVPQVVVPHQFRAATPYKKDGAHFGHNLLRTALVHFNHERVARVIANAQTRGGFSAAMALTSSSDIETRRASLMGKRVRDDDWFFNTFAASS